MRRREASARCICDGDHRPVFGRQDLTVLPATVLHLALDLVTRSGR